MNNSSITKLIFSGLLTWIIPFLASFFFIDQNTKSYIPNELVFKLIMIAILAGITLVIYLYLRLKTELNWLLVAGFFLFLNCVLDNIFLIGLFKYELIKWVLTVLPIYIVIFFGLASFELKRKPKSQPIVEVKLETDTQKI
jgi:hypothetical protein